MFKFVSGFFLYVILLSQPVLAETTPDFAAIIRENGDAVVAISVAQNHIAVARPAEPWMPKNRSLGSGFVISEDGYILTNYHVIKDSNQIMVKFKDRHVSEATLMGFDRVTDIALLKVKDSGLTKVKIGSASSLVVGEWVIAIGAPFGFEQSATKGIVSGKDRMVSNDVYVPFIQTDVAINQGNSGGPLFNGKGAVVGINSWIYSDSGEYIGLSFAIPIDLAMNVVSQIKSKGKVSRGWLGVKTQEVPLELAQSFAMPRAYGAMISEIALAGPAQKAGLMVADIVIGFNGQSVENAAELPARVGMATAGSKIDLEIIRQGERRTIEVKVGQSPGN